MEMGNVSKRQQPKFHRFLFTYTKVMVRKPRKMLIWAPFWPPIPQLLGYQLLKSMPTFLLCS